MRNSLMLVFGLMLVACAPNNVRSELWARNIFVPTQANAQQGCSAAFSQSPGNYIGEKTFSSSQGQVRLISAPGDIGVFCQLLGILLSDSSALNSFFATEEFAALAKKANAGVIVFTKSTSLKDTSAYLSLEDASGKEFSQVRSFTVEGVIPGVRFNFNQLTEIDVLNIGKALSFTIVINRGFGEERFPVNQNNFNPFALNR